MFILTIILASTVGWTDQVTYKEGQPYETLELCRGAGELAINWLSQDLMRVEYTCEYREKSEN